MRDSENLCWGSRSLFLKLPASKIELSGLSPFQHSVLQESYKRFISENSKEFHPDIKCMVFKLQQAIDISPEDFIRDGLYTTLVTRNKNKQGFELTGTNFRARVNSDSYPTLSSLGVYSEKDLVQTVVVENYLRLVVAHLVLQSGGVELHSAGLVFDNEAYIFSGRSNAGKTTLTQKAYYKNTRVLSDDINIVLPNGNGYDAYAVPFTGEFGRTLDHAGGKESYPVAGIILLEQSDHLETAPVSTSAAVARLLTGCPFVNTDEHELEALFDSVTGLVSKVPVIRLLSRKDNDIDDIMQAVKQQFDALRDNPSLLPSGISCGYENKSAATTV